MPLISANSLNLLLEVGFNLLAVLLTGLFLILTLGLRYPKFRVRPLFPKKPGRFSLSGKLHLFRDKESINTGLQFVSNFGDEVLTAGQFFWAKFLGAIICFLLGITLSVLRVGVNEIRGIQPATFLPLPWEIGLWFLTLAGLTFYGLFAPDLWLRYGEIYRKRLEINARIPDVLDLLAVSLSAGAEFDNALTRIANNLSGTLQKELNLALMERDLGQSRELYLEALAFRTRGLDPASASQEERRRLRSTGLGQAVDEFVHSVVRSTELGIPLKETLQEQAKVARIKRQQFAEKRARNAQLNVSLPLSLFILAIMLMTIGPSLLLFLKI